MSPALVAAPAASIGRRHPAVRAWLQVGRSAQEPRAIEILKCGGGSAVYRLWGSGPMGTSVIAKRCSADAARVERAAHEMVLPSLPVAVPRYLGCFDDHPARSTWIFLEDAGDHRYSPSAAEHRDTLTRWLAALHASASSIEADPTLPDRGPAHYLEHLRATRDEARLRAGDTPLSAEYRAVLDGVRAGLDAVESRWDSVAALCARAPRTFVHGDPTERSIRVRRTPGGLVVLPLDWKHAGWGVPAIDLAVCPLRSLYGFLVRPRWPDLTPDRLHDLREAGLIFGTLASIRDELHRLGPRSIERPMRRLRAHHRRLGESLARLSDGWCLPPSESGGAGAPGPLIASSNGGAPCPRAEDRSGDDSSSRA